MAKDFFQQLRDAPERKPSWKRSQNDASNLREAFDEHRKAEVEKHSQRGPESDIEDIDWGIPFDERKGK